MDISKTELKVLKAIWQDHPVSSNEIIERLNNGGEEWHEKTVKTLIGRLVKKQAIDFHREGRRYLYFPLVSEEDYQFQQSDSLISGFFKGKVSPLFAMFAQQNKLNQDDIQELKQLIERWEKDND
ncbi:BlaI/MecI/CopY family transcriptional regulator [Alteromonadaceae bacterium M269]|nr:BlaI/MecI/CopY family transcriptional regulator [Alteromonadaceae bacterium M269]